MNGGRSKRSVSDKKLQCNHHQQRTPERKMENRLEHTIRGERERQPGKRMCVQRITVDTRDWLERWVGSRGDSETMCDGAFQNALCLTLSITETAAVLYIQHMISARDGYRDDTTDICRVGESSSMATKTASTRARNGWTDGLIKLATANSSK